MTENVVVAPEVVEVTVEPSPLSAKTRDAVPLIVVVVKEPEPEPQSPDVVWTKPLFRT